MGKITSYQTAEYGKFEEIIGNSLYPAVSVTRWSYPDTSNAFPENTGLSPVSSVDIYGKYAVLTKLINPEDISVSLSSGDITIDLDTLELLQTQTNTKLDTLTSVEYATESKQDSIISAIQSLSSVNRINGFVLPDYNRIKNYYYGSSNNISQVDYKYGNTVVASLSFTYVGDSSIDNALLNEVIKL